VRNEDVRDYFVAMTRVFRCGDLEVKGFTDGSLKTSLDFVLGMERAASEELVGGTDGGALFIPVNNFLFQRDGATVLSAAFTAGSRDGAANQAVALALCKAFTLFTWVMWSMGEEGPPSMPTLANGW
jgi:hypothetical protein